MALDIHLENIAENRHIEVFLLECNIRNSQIQIDSQTSTYYFQISDPDLDNLQLTAGAQKLESDPTEGALSLDVTIINRNSGRNDIITEATDNFAIEIYLTDVDLSNELTSDTLGMKTEPTLSAKDSALGSSGSFVLASLSAQFTLLDENCQDVNYICASLKDTSHNNYVDVEPEPFLNTVCDNEVDNYITCRVGE